MTKLVEREGGFGDWVSPSAVWRFKQFPNIHLWCHDGQHQLNCEPGWILAVHQVDGFECPEWLDALVAEATLVRFDIRVLFGRSFATRRQAVDALTLAYLQPSGSPLPALLFSDR